MGKIEAHLARGVGAWVDAVRRRAGTTLLLAVVLSVASLHAVATLLGVVSDTDLLFDSELPFRKDVVEFETAFPDLRNNLLLVIEADTPDRARDGARALAERLRAAGSPLANVYLPGGGSFFEQHSLLYLELDDLEELADRLAEVQPYLAELSRDETLRGLFAMLSRAVDALERGEAQGFDLDWVFDRVALAVEAARDDRGYQLSWEELIRGRIALPEDRRRVLVVKPVTDYTAYQPGRESIAYVRAAAAELGFTDGGPLRLGITGDLALKTEELTVVRAQAAWAGVASLVLVTAILFAALGSGRLVLATVITLLTGLLWTFGFAAVAIGRLNIVSISFAVLFIGLAVDFGIHLCMRYGELRAGGGPPDRALGKASSEVGSALVLCAATTAIGFFAFLPTDYRGVAELGLIAGVGMFISLFATLTVLPALLALVGTPAGGRRLRAIRLPRFPERHPKAVRIGAVVVFLASAAMLPQVRFDTSPLAVRDPTLESVQTYRRLVAEGGSSPWTVDLLAEDLASARALASRLEALPEVDRAVTIADLVPGDQEAKLAILEDVALFMTPGVSLDPMLPPTIAEQREALRDLAARLPALAGDEELAPSATRLASALTGLERRLAGSDEPGEILAGLEESLLGALPERMRLLRASLAARSVDGDDLPDDLRERLVARDGRLRVQVFPVEDLNDPDAMERFADAVRVEAPRATGMPVRIVASARVVVRALQEALVAAVVIITLLLLFLWRRVSDALTVLGPLLLAASVTCAIAVLADIPFNYADVIVIPLLLGIGVDSGIHLVQRHRMQGAAAGLLHTGTARAVFYSALTTIASFGTLGFATHRGMATLGQLLAIGVAVTLASNLFVVPALLARRRGSTPV